MHFTNPEDGVFVATLGDGPTDGAGFVHVNRDQRGDGADHPPPADHTGDFFLVQTVLQRHHITVGGEILADHHRRPFGVIGFHRQEGDVDRPLLIQVLQFGDVHGLGGGHGHLFVGGDAVQGQTMGADPRDILRPHVDQGHIVSMLGEMSAHVPAQRADPDDRDSLRHIASSRYKR